MENLTYKIVKVQWNYSDVINQNYQTGECDYVNEHYLISLVNVDNPFDSLVKVVDKLNYSCEEFYIGRLVKL